MATNAIGTGSVILSANADQLSAGLLRAQQDVEAWASKIEARASKAGGKSGLLGGMLGGAAAGGIAGAIAGLGVGAATKGFELLEQAGVAALSKIADVSKNAATAQAMGLSAEAWTGMAGLAKSVGGDTREFTESMVTLGKLTDDALSGSGEVATGFFRDLGMSAEAFKSLGPEQGFYKLFDSLKAIEDPAKRVRLLMNAFGEDGGKNLLPLLGKSSEELRKMAGGYTLSADSMARAQVAQESVTRASAALDQAWTKIVIAASPVIDVLASAIPSAIEAVVGNFDGLEKMVIPTMKSIAHAGGYVWDVLKIGYEVARDTAKAIGALFETLFSSIKAAVNLIPEKLRPDWLTVMSPGLALLPGIGDGAKAADKFFDDWEKRRNERIKGVAGNLAGSKMLGGAGADNSPNANPMKFAAAIQAGSKEAYSLNLKQKYRETGIADAAKKVQEKQLAETQKTNRLLEEQAEIIRAGLNLEVK